MESTHTTTYARVGFTGLFFTITFACFAHQEPVLHVFNHEGAVEVERLQDALYDLYICSFHDVYREFWSEKFEHFMHKNFNHYFEKFKSTDSMTLVVAKHGQDICGWILFDYNQDKSQAIIELICVDIHMKRQGIGKRLVCAIRDLIPEVTTMSLVTKKINTISPHFYESLGFVKTDFMLPEYNAELMQGYEWNEESKDLL